MSAADIGPKRSVVASEQLPENYPTHRHSNEFWEALGRAVATYGFLEEALGKAIFAFTATREIPEETFQVEYEKWLPTLQRAISDPLGGRIDAYDKAVRANTAATIENLENLIDDLREAAVCRNVLCHGSWRIPDESGKSTPFFVDKKQRVFDTPIDVAYLDAVRRHVVGLICAVVSSVTHMGWQFPGSSGPGVPIMQPRRAKP